MYFLKIFSILYSISGFEIFRYYTIHVVELPTSIYTLYPYIILYYISPITVFIRREVVTLVLSPKRHLAQPATALNQRIRQAAALA